MLIQSRDLTLQYHDGTRFISAVNKVSISLPETGLYGILGPSGSGKTSLLYLLAGLKKPTSGQLLYNGISYPETASEMNYLRRNEMGFIFQSNFLIDYLTVRENIAVGSDKKYKEAKPLIESIAMQLNIFHLLDRRIEQLSGGEKQRVTIARALANEPKVIFVDEPTSSLDHVVGKRVVEILERISKTSCVVMVTHDESNLSHADYIFSIWDGKIMGLGEKKMLNSAVLASNPLVTPESETIAPATIPPLINSNIVANNLMAEKIALNNLAHVNGAVNLPNPSNPGMQ
jgi:putative ABC transport system ATP-binding protein